MDVWKRLAALIFWKKHVDKHLHAEWFLTQTEVTQFPRLWACRSQTAKHCPGLLTGYFTYIQFKINLGLVIGLHYTNVGVNLYAPQTLYLAVIHFGSHHSFHIFLFHCRGNTKAVPHAQYLCSSIRVCHLHRAIQNDWPGIQLQIKHCRIHEDQIT